LHQDFQELHVGDRIDASINAVLDRLRRSCVGDRGTLQRVGRLHSDAQLVDRVRREIWNSTSGAATGSDQLDDIRTLAHQHTYIASDFIWRVRDAACPPDVASTVRNRAQW
jgi:hypothetical protein